MEIVQIHFAYRFQNVGQGLFTSGKLVVNRPAPSLRWVFDCGSASRDELVTSGLSRLERHFEGRGRIDLVAISHFDKDHISGVCQLLKRFPTDVLMLPYVARDIRLRLAAAQRVRRGHPLHGFYDNPVRYLVALPGADILRIVFVLPGGAPPPRGPDDRPSLDNRDHPGGLLVPDGPPVPEGVLETPPGGKPAVQTTLNGEPLTFRDVWEFVPYNDMKVPLRVGGPKAFPAEVMAVKDELKGASGARERDEALRRLKWLYDDTFGSGSRRRNEISLHLYGGPIGAVESWLNHATGVRYVQDGQTLRTEWMRLHGHFSPCGVLYTGDGYLSTNARLKRLIDCPTEERIGRVAVFQVMHHGAETNWHEGVAARIAPEFSVFSSDPIHKSFRHPHEPVVKDFLTCSTPLQVDTKRYASFDGVVNVEAP